MSTVLWFVGFGLMMASFSFLFGRNTEPQHSRPRISIDYDINPPRRTN